MVLCQKLKENPRRIHCVKFREKNHKKQNKPHMFWLLHAVEVIYQVIDDEQYIVRMIISSVTIKKMIIIDSNQQQTNSLQFRTQAYY